MAAARLKGAIRSSLVPFGNSLALIIPDAMVAQLGLGRTVELEVDNDAIVLRKPKRRTVAAQRGETSRPKQPAAYDDLAAARTVYRLKVVLRDVRPQVWRRIEVRGDTTLPRLHRFLQIAMGWEDSHLHAFAVGEATYGTPYERDELGFRDERRVRLAQIMPAPKQRFRYDYDFGDGWMHDVVVESIRPWSGEASYPKFIAGENACPPEDVGGVPGYDHFLEVIDDPSHEEHADLVQWVGRRFNPRVVDVASIEEGFARFAAADAKKSGREV